jgi:hypothetical protein
MKKIFLLLSLASTALLCGCDKQTKINSEKIELLSRNILQFEQNQIRQMATIQTELTSLGPMLDKMNDFYFEKSHDQAFFFHTNTLYLLLMVDKKIESQLQLADTERAAQNVEAYDYYTNQMATLFQVQDALAAQEGRIEDKVNAETKSASDNLQQQIKLLAPDAAAIARQQEMAATVAEIKRELDQVKAQLGALTNQPSVR